MTSMFAMPQKVGVQDCSEASLTGDARDKFFISAVAEFNPAAAAPMRSAAPLLENAIKELGGITSDVAEKSASCKGTSLLETSFISVSDDILVDTIKSAEDVILKSM